MRASDLEILLHEGESSMLEYKESVSSSFARDLAAFANSTGGRIIIGVRDDGTIIGVQDSNEIRARIQDIARNCDPPVSILIEAIDRLLVVTVREAENKPVQCREGFFWRQGASTQKLTRTEILEFFRSEGAIRFDLAICSKFHYPDDFDQDKFDDWLSRSRISFRGRIEDILVNIDVAERLSGKLLFRNAGVLFFAKNVRRFFPQAYTTCLLCRGRDKVHILDRKDFSEGIVRDIEDALRFIERNTRTAYRIEGLKRQEVPEYPVNALREGITNAVMHRDYFEIGSNVFVEIYSNRIEISNPGGLPRGLNRKRLGTLSVRRNPIVADLLHRIDFIEKAGTGIQRMKEAARDHLCPPPVFNVDGFFNIKFKPTNDEIFNISEKRAIYEVKSNVLQSDAGSTRALLRIEILKKCREATALRDLLKLWGRFDRVGFRNRFLKPLLEEDLIEMTIPEKPTSPKQRYRTTESGKKLLSRLMGTKRDRQ